MLAGLKDTYDHLWTCFLWFGVDNVRYPKAFAVSSRVAMLLLCKFTVVSNIGIMVAAIESSSSAFTVLQV